MLAAVRPQLNRARGQQHSHLHANADVSGPVVRGS